LTAEAFSTFGFSTFTILAEDRKDIRCVNKLCQYFQRFSIEQVGKDHCGSGEPGSTGKWQMNLENTKYYATMCFDTMGSV